MGNLRKLSLQNPLLKAKFAKILYSKKQFVTLNSLYADLGIKTQEIEGNCFFKATFKLKLAKIVTLNRKCKEIVLTFQDTLLYFRRFKVSIRLLPLVLIIW